MSENKKYYWLKLKDNFFDSEEMKIIEAQENSSNYQILYLKLCLLSLKNDGCLSFKGCIPYDSKMLSTITRIDFDTVIVGLKLFIDLGLIEKMDSGIMFMSDIESLIGKGSSEADRKVLFRERIKQQRLLEGGGQTSAKRPPEKEIEIEIEKESIAETGGLETGIRHSKKESISDPEMFERFWSTYGKMIGKANTIKHWNKLKTEDHQLIINSLSPYLTDRPDKRYRKDPERYIRDKVYLDYQEKVKPKFKDYQ